MSKPVRTIWLRLLAVVILAVAVSSCSESIRNIKINSVQFESYEITSSKTLIATLRVGIDNPAKNVQISNLCSVLKFGGEDIAIVNAPDVELEGHSSLEYSIPCEATLADGVSLLRAGMMLANMDSSKLTADISFGLTPQGGQCRLLNIKDLDVVSLIEQNQL